MGLSEDLTVYPETWTPDHAYHAKAGMAGNGAACEAVRRRSVGLPEEEPRIDGSKIHRLYVEAGRYYQQLQDEVNESEVEVEKGYWANVKRRYRSLCLRRRARAAELEGLLREARGAAEQWRGLYVARGTEMQCGLPWESEEDGEQLLLAASGRIKKRRAAINARHKKQHVASKGDGAGGCDVGV